MKKIITSNQVLKFYNSKLPIRLTSDASQNGLGSVLEQKHNERWLPVAFSSRALSQAEKNYSQIEKETLSILFGCEKFDEMLYGRTFLVINDHKPLKTILMKPLLKVPPRIQRFLLRLQRYDFQIEYAPGKTVVVADTLSRAFLPNNSPAITEDEMKCHIHVVMQHLPMSPKKMMQYQQETKNDEVLNIIREGWPLSKKDVIVVA